MSDDSSYDVLSVDGDLVDEAASEEEEPEISGDSQNFVFDLPASLLEGSNGFHDSHNAHPPVINNAANDPSVASLSTTSSFVPVSALGRMNVNGSSVARPEAHDSNQGTRNAAFNSDDDGSWSHFGYRSPAVPSAATSTATWNSYCPSDEASLAASSTVSGFDLISLSGASKRRCKSCTFLNKDEDGICAGCEQALVANPCVEVDEQLAWRLKMRDDELELQRLIESENKRKKFWSEPLLYQSQSFADEISRNMGTSLRFKDKPVLTMVPPVCLTILASRFIECFVQGGPSFYTVSVGFHFSHKFNRPLDVIQQVGFGDETALCVTPYAALVAVGGPTRQTLTLAAKQPGNALPSIPESTMAYDLTLFDETNLNTQPGNMYADAKEITDYIGWIAVYLSCETDSFETNFVEQDTVTKVQKSVQALPLACFDASLLDDSVLHRRFQGLSQLCLDFFWRDDSTGVSQAAEPEPAYKKPKLDEPFETTVSFDDAIDEAMRQVDMEGKATEQLQIPYGWDTDEDLARLIEATVWVDDVYSDQPEEDSKPMAHPVSIHETASDMELRSASTAGKADMEGKATEQLEIPYGWDTDEDLARLLEATVCVDDVNRDQPEEDNKPMEHPFSIHETASDTDLRRAGAAGGPDDHTNPTTLVLLPLSCNPPLEDGMSPTLPYAIGSVLNDKSHRRKPLEP